VARTSAAILPKETKAVTLFVQIFQLAILEPTLVIWVNEVIE
jgi:hypothetical protein